MATNEQIEGALRGLAAFAVKDRRMAYSFSLVVAGSIMAIAGHVDAAILNFLGAIWLKMDYPH